MICTKRLKYDLEYLNNWSFGLDIKIVLMTVLEILKQCIEQGTHTPDRKFLERGESIK